MHEDQRGHADPRPAALAAAATAGGSRFAIWPRRWLYVVLAAAGLALARSWNLPWAQSAALAGIAVVLVDQLLRWVVTRQLAALDAEIQARLQAGGREELLARYNARLLLRALAPRHELGVRRALIHRQRGELDAAAAALREALEDAPAKQAAELAQQLADVLYGAGQHLEAERWYRVSQDERNSNPGVRARIARLILARDGDRAEAARLLREAVDAAQGQPGCGVFRCQLAEVLAQLGQRDDALWQLQIAEEELAGGSADERARLAAAHAVVEGAAP